MKNSIDVKKELITRITTTRERIGAEVKSVEEMLDHSILELRCTLNGMQTFNARMDYLKAKYTK